MAAQAARLWRQVDPAFAGRCLAAARRAWAAAARNPAVFAAEGFTGSGGYGDTRLADERRWAADELYATTGEPTFAPALPLAAVTQPGWADVAALGTITLATADGVPTPIYDAARMRIVAAADGSLGETGAHGYGLPYAATHYGWGSNGTLLNRATLLVNRAMLLGLAAHFTGETRYRAGAVDVADCVLGRNRLGQSYISGFGWRPLLRPRHRFWAQSVDPKLPPPPPGARSGGPNDTAMVDPVALQLKGRCAPQRCWADENAAYSLNEVAINWNAPLVWVTAYLDAG